MKVLVLGHYGKFNLGDNLFIDAFRKIFPELEFIFVDEILLFNIKDISAIFIGGGSFLFAEPAIAKEVLPIVKNKPIFYISVGSETDIHQGHLELMAIAKLIAIRNIDKFDKIKSINENTIIIPDIVYALQNNVRSIKKHKSVLIIPNLTVVPNWHDTQWKHSSWNYFKSEFCQFIDVIIDMGYNVNFFSMSTSSTYDDTNAAIEIINFLKKRNNSMIINDNIVTADDAIKLFSSYDIIITQRFHGIILAELARVPCISIYHHDKLKQSFLNEGSFIPYYGLYKQKLLDDFYCTIKKKYSQNLPIETNIFNDLRERILQQIGR